jgi:hypothetical protein
MPSSHGTQGSGQSTQLMDCDGNETIYGPGHRDTGLQIAMEISRAAPGRLSRAAPAAPRPP